MSKYNRTIYDCEAARCGCTVDVYSVLAAFEVTCPATAHAVKKLLAAGKRGHKSYIEDLEEARDSITRAILIAQQSDNGST